MVKELLSGSWRASDVKKDCLTPPHRRSHRLGVLGVPPPLPAFSFLSTLRERRCFFGD